jgi:hypothetical protein
MMGLPGMSPNYLIGIWAAQTLDIRDHRAMRLASALHNASYSAIRLHDGDALLFTLNQTPHLEPALRTLR